MPEYIFVFIASGIFSILGLTLNKFDKADRRLDALELKVAEKYVTKEDFNMRFDNLLKVLNRLEEKVDAHVSEDADRIKNMKQRYFNQ